MVVPHRTFHAANGHTTQAAVCAPLPISLSLSPLFGTVIRTSTLSLSTVWTWGRSDTAVERGVMLPI